MFSTVCKTLLKTNFWVFSLSLRSYEWMSSGTHASNPFKFINKASTQGVTWLFTAVCCVDSETKESPKALCLFRNIDVIRDMQWFSTNCGVFVLLWWWSLIAHGCHSRVFLSVDFFLSNHITIKQTNKRRHTYNFITAKTLFWFSSFQFNGAQFLFIYLYIVHYNNSCLKGFKCNWLLHSPDSDVSSSSILLMITLNLSFGFAQNQMMCQSMTMDAE